MINTSLCRFAVIGFFALTAALPCMAQEVDTTRGIGMADDAKSYAPYPAPDAGYVTDLGDLLTVEQEEEIEQWLWEVEQETGVELAVLTLDSIKQYTNDKGLSIEEFARGVFNAWGVGNLPNNDGALLVVAVQDREARIELGAHYGNLRDDDAAKIMNRKIVPRFKQGKYADGVRDGVKAMSLEFADHRLGPNWMLIMLAAIAALFAPLFFSLFYSGKRGWGWRTVGGFGNVWHGWYLSWLAAQQQATRTQSSSGSSFNWSSGGGSGGFGGGFGGGFSGGGGATGKW